MEIKRRLASRGIVGLTEQEWNDRYHRQPAATTSLPQPYRNTPTDTYDAPRSPAKTAKQVSTASKEKDRKKRWPVGPIAAMFTIIPLLIILAAVILSLADGEEDRPDKAHALRQTTESSPAQNDHTVALNPLIFAGGGSRIDRKYTPKTIHFGGAGLPKKAGRHIMCLAVDYTGRLWAGTEGRGVWCGKPSGTGTRRWEQYTQQNTDGGLGDDFAYAIACDARGRIWVGHLNHGVSVYNGTTWANYGMLKGPGGTRIFDIFADKISGDVWIASDTGLCRYETRKDTWTTYTRAEGLPEEQVQALATDQYGRVYAGTQTRGIAIADPEPTRRSMPYTQWKSAHCNTAPFPPTATGRGLPSNLINDILVSRNNTVYAATNHGLAVSRNRGNTWQYIRGRGWKAMVEGLHKGPPATDNADPRTLLPGEYITALAEDAEGRIWMGFRQHGVACLDPTDWQLVYRSASGRHAKDFVQAIALSKHTGPLTGWYGKGLKRVNSKEVIAPSPVARLSSQARDAQLPSPRGAPAASELRRINRAVGTMLSAETKTDIRAPNAVYVGEDWQTRGDWLGRYGRYWSNLCAICAPRNYFWGAGLDRVRYENTIGPNHRAGDVIRHWVWKLYEKDRRVLEMPPAYLHSRVLKGFTDGSRTRRPAGVDDHAEAYKWTMEGPDLWFTIRPPRGLFQLSLYFVNYDGHRGNNRFRDYVLEVRKTRAGEPGEILAKTRIRDWWAGVYKRFVIRGGHTYHIKVAKNNSFNTMCMGLFLDLLDERPYPYHKTYQQWRDNRHRTLPLSHTATRHALADTSAGAGVAGQLLNTLERWRYARPMEWAVKSRPYYRSLLAYVEKTAGGTGTIESMRGLCCYRLNRYEEWEASLSRQQVRTARAIEKSIKWDGKTYSCVGKGYQLIKQRVEQLKEN